MTSFVLAVALGNVEIVKLFLENRKLDINILGICISLYL